MTVRNFAHVFTHIWNLHPWRCRMNDLGLISLNRSTVICYVYFEEGTKPRGLGPGLIQKILEAFNQSPVGIFQLHTSNFLWVQTMPGFPGSSVVKNPPVKQETQVPFLGQKDTLEREMPPHCSILAWRSPWTEEPGGLQSLGLQRVRHNWVTNTICKMSHNCSVRCCEDYIKFLKSP